MNAIRYELIVIAPTITRVHVNRANAHPASVTLGVWKN